MWSPSSTTTASWPGLWPGTGTSVTSPASVSAMLAGKGPNRPAGRSTGSGEPGGPALVWVAAKASTQPRRIVEFDPRDEDLGVGEVVQSARVVGVEMGQDDPAHVAGPDPEPLELRADLLLGPTRSRTAKRKNGCQRGK